MRVMIAAGGTGGHVYPALAFVEELRQQAFAAEAQWSADVHWIGTESGIEARLVPQADIPLHVIVAKGLRGKGWFSKLHSLWQFSLSIGSVIAVLRKVKPDVVLGMGGYAAGAAGVAAWLLRIPLVVHEQNARMGLTNRWLAHFAKKVIWGLPCPDEYRLQHKCLRLGNPLRQVFHPISRPAERIGSARRCRRVLVLGGSLGAAAINQALPELFNDLRTQLSAETLGCKQVDIIEVLHQCGQRHLDSTLAEYSKYDLLAQTSALVKTGIVIQVTVVPFVEDMASKYANADFVICRSGALTVSELAAVGVGAILIPFPYAVDNHQWHNANVLLSAGAAEVVDQTACASQQVFQKRLLAVVREWLCMEQETLIKKGQLAQSVGMPEAAKHLVACVLGCARK